MISLRYLKIFYSRLIFNKLVPVIWEIKSNYIFSELSCTILPLLLLRRPVRYLSLIVKGDQCLVFDKRTRKTNRILTRNRFTRIASCGGFEETGIYLAKVYKIDINKQIDSYLEIGPNIGELTSLIIARCQPRNVCLVEADQLALDCLNYNLKNLSSKSIKILKAFASQKTGFQESQSASEDASSSLFLDDKHIGNRKFIETIRLDEYLPEIFDNKTIDLVKIEAEGYEPEVLLGMQGYLCHIKSIVIDCGPERGGDTTYDSCSKILLQEGFRTLMSGNYLFAERSESA